MNFLEKLMLALLATGGTLAPVFVHSTQGVLILNASEALVGELATLYGNPKPSAPSPVVEVPGMAGVPVV